MTTLQTQFLAWAEGAGLTQYRPGVVSRVDWAVDYHLPVIDFDESHVVSLAAKDSLDMGDGLVEALLVVDVSALTVTGGDEAYTLVLEGAPDAAFSSAEDIRVLAMLTIGAAAACAPNGADDTTGRYVIPFRNERGAAAFQYTVTGTTCRYLRLYTVLAGASPSLAFGAFIAKRAPTTVRKQ